MTDQNLLFQVDREKLFKLGTNFLKSKEGSDAISAGELKGEERLFLSLLGTHLLNTKMYLPQKNLIKFGDQFEEAYLVVSGEVEIKQGEKVYKLGAGSVLGLSEGMVGLASRYSATSISAIQVKIIPFHKVDAIMNVLPSELKAILVTIIKRNLAV
jgi:CRP-like cAMP-binding protein